MPQKKDNLPINADVDLQNGGTITYANEVIAIIAGVAANEVDGVAGMCISGGFGDIIGRNRNITRGVKVEIGSEEAAVDLFTIIEYGKPIQKVASEVQENVRKAIESMTGLHVVRVDVHVQGVSFEKERIAAQSSLEAAHNAVLESPKPVSPAPEEEKPKEAPTEAQHAPDEPVPDECACTECAECGESPVCDACAECDDVPVCEECTECGEAPCCEGGVCVECGNAPEQCVADETVCAAYENEAPAAEEISDGAAEEAPAPPDENDEPKKETGAKKRRALKRS